MGVPIYPVDQPAYEQAVAASRRAMGEQAFAVAWEQGRTLPLEQFMADILQRGEEAGKT